MKPIVIDMKEISDSTEVYESKPGRVLIYTIYIILGVFVTAFLWMTFSKMDIVVKSNGIFRCDTPVYEISSGVTGKVVSCNVRDGQLVKEGDVLFVLDAESLGETIKSYQNELEDINQRLEILNAYEKSLGGDEDALDALSNNIYYQEFVNRRDLLFAGIEAESQNIQGETEIYQGNIDAVSTAIQQYEAKKEKLEQAKACVISRMNQFGEEDAYYNSMVASYISNYNLTASAYASETEKQQALANLEQQQIAAIEQEIEGINDTVLSLQTNLTQVQLQLEALGDKDASVTQDIKILTEKGNIAAEILSYQDKKEECESYLEKYDVQSNNCNILASATGYFYLQQEIKQGTYINEGASVGKIYPEENTDYYAEIYVENADIAKLQEGQQVKFEIAAYPASEYGYFTGEVANIPKDFTVEQESGSAYYLVRVSCDNILVKNKEGDTGTIINGMSCQAKVIIDEENVLQYLLKKIELLD